MPTFFRIKGFVSRKPFVGPKVAFLPVEVDTERGKAYYEVKAFEMSLMQTIEGLQVGAEVTIDGELMSEQVRVDKQPITDARGKTVFGVGLKATKVTAKELQKRPETARSSRFDDGDEPPF